MIAKKQDSKKGDSKKKKQVQKWGTVVRVYFTEREIDEIQYAQTRDEWFDVDVGSVAVDKLKTLASRVNTKANVIITKHLFGGKAGAVARMPNGKLKALPFEVLCFEISPKELKKIDDDKLMKIIKHVEEEYDGIPVVQINLDAEEVDNETLNRFLSIRDKFNYPVKIHEPPKDIYSDEKGKTREIQEVLAAQKKADELTDYIKSLNLSPFEQYILIHDYVSGKPYKETPGSKFDCRSFVDCMNSDQIVCVGYAVLMEALCKRLGIECLRTSPTVFGLEGLQGHSFNIVHLVDPKYNINGYYLTDATWDETSQFGDSGEKVKNEDATRNYLYLAYPVNLIGRDGHKVFKRNLEMFNYWKDKIDHPSPRIDAQTLKTAVENAYKIRDGKKYDQKTIDANIAATLQRAKSKGLVPYPPVTNQASKETDMDM